MKIAQISDRCTLYYEEKLLKEEQLVQNLHIKNGDLLTVSDLIIIKIDIYVAD